MKTTFCLSSRLVKQRLGRIGHVALIDGAVVEKLGLVAHLLDDVIGRIALGARHPQIETIGAVMAEIVHRTVEPGPMLLLFGREVQLLLDPLDIGVAVGDDLFGASVAARRSG